MAKVLQALSLFTAKLINFTDLGGKLGFHRVTVKKYVSLLEQLFLLDYLPAWHNNSYKRLIKTPKIHMADTGVVCSARGINADKIRLNPNFLGELIETFIFNELKKQSYFIDEKLSFYYYQDKDGYEVDIVIEDALEQVIGIEIKAAASVSQKDFRGLTRLKEIAGNNFKLGILLYDGDHSASFGDKLFVVPVASLWS